MKRLMLLFVVASIAFFVFILRTPGRLLPSAIFGQDESKQTPAKADAKLAASPTAKSARAANFATRREAPTTEPTSPATAAEVEIQVSKKAPVRTHPLNSHVMSSKVLTISGDSAALYVNNSTGSNVLTVLSRGTIIEPDLQILDAAGSWTMVRIPTLNISGFVQTGNLATLSHETVPE
jgi:hypothetical protein